MTEQPIGLRWKFNYQADHIWMFCKKITRTIKLGNRLHLNWISLVVLSGYVVVETVILIKISISKFN